MFGLTSNSMPKNVIDKPLKLGCKQEVLVYRPVVQEQLCVLNPSSLLADEIVARVLFVWHNACRSSVCLKHKVAAHVWQTQGDTV